MKTKLIALAVSTTAAFALSGCIKADIDMKVKSDTKVDGTMIVAFSAETMKMMEGMAGSMDSSATKSKSKSFDQQMKDSVAEAQKKAPKGTKISLYKKDGWVGQKIEFTDMDLKTALAQGNSAGDAAGSGSAAPSSLTIVKKGDTLVLNGFFGEDAKKGDASSGMDPEAMMSMGGKKPELRYKFTFPGKVISANGKIDGNSVTWNPSLTKKTVMKAVAKAS